MVSRLLYLLLLALSVHYQDTEASTHWLLNTNGQIIPQVRTNHIAKLISNCAIISQIDHVTLNLLDSIHPYS